MASDRSRQGLATTDARERTIKRLMKQLHGGSVRLAIEDLVRLTGHCRDTDERLAILEPYLQERLPERFIPTIGELIALRYERKDETMRGLLLPATLLVLLIPCRAGAFIFTDPVAQAQRITMIG